MALGAAMLVPFCVDLLGGEGDPATFGASAFLTATTGVCLTIACAPTKTAGLTLQQVFLLTSLTWLLLPLFGALPFMLGAPGASFTDAYFEAMSGLTTTGSTVFTDLSGLPMGTNLWRGLLQWFGGIGIVVVALAFLPSLKIGGMQIFRSEAFDTFGKILPRAAEIAASVAWIYVGLTIACWLCYAWAGMGPFDAVMHALTTVSTGGFSNSDASMGRFEPQVEYVATVFMLLASLPFVRYIQLMSGAGGAFLSDSQVRAYLGLITIVVGVLALYVGLTSVTPVEQAVREALFNSVSIISGTGYASTDYQLWGPFAVAVFFLIGLVGGCAGSTSCSVKIFRYELLAAALNTRIRQVHNPSGIFTPRYEGRPIPDDVLNSVIAFFMLFLSSLAVTAILLTLIGLDTVTAISGAASALGNIGPGLGPIIGPAGSFAPLPDSAKWVLAAAMYLGRLELMSVFVLFTRAFWVR
ncbi:MAG: TrkH family potassium uptake protein [Pseudomonadota bacterium]